MATATRKRASVHYSVKDLWVAARHAGFTANQAVIAVAISLAENQAQRNDALNLNTNGSTDKGAWQINSVNSDVIRKEGGNPYSLAANARMAHDIYMRQGWRAWSTYNSGAYKAHLPNAVKVSGIKPGSSIWNDIWSHISLTPYAAPNMYSVGGKDSGAAVKIDNPLKPMEAIGNLAGHLQDSGFWKRIGMGALGVLVLVVALVFMLESNKTVRGITEKAALA